MSSVTCAICGARKGAANNWWALVETGGDRAVWIGRIEEAETLQSSKPDAVPVPLCGVECLYRKLNGILLPEPAMLATRAPRTPNNSPAGHIAPSPLRGILRRAKDAKPSASAPGGSDPVIAVGLNGKGGSLRPRENAAIGQGVTILGQIQSDETLSVNGELAGMVDLPNHRLTVGPTGKVRATVRAREVEIFGLIEGQIQADKIVVRKNATLVGDISTLSLAIEEGAVFEGQSRRAAPRETPRL